MIYGPKDLAEAFRTVRKNTVQIAEDIPEHQYSFRATPDVMSIAEELVHIACSTWWPHQAHGVDKKTLLAFDDFGKYMARTREMEKELTGKSAIVEALKTKGEAFAAFLEALRDDQLAEKVSFPPPMQPSQKTRFEMLLSVKEHEMHHRAKLMLVQRLIGQVPHITRRRQEMQAARTAAAAAAGAARA